MADARNSRDRTYSWANISDARKSRDRRAGSDQERTRTFTAVKPRAPEASASTNSATWARPVGSREPVPLKLRPRRVNGAAQGTLSPHCGAPPHRLSAGLLGLRNNKPTHAEPRHRFRRIRL